MHVSEKVYLSLSTFFSVIMIVGNLTYQKFVFLPILSWYTFELSVGALLYPLTFLITDLIAEFFGKEKANFCIKLAILLNVVVAIIITGMDFFESTSWSIIDKETFHRVFGFYSVSFMGSIIACYVAQKLDIHIYLWIRTLTKERFLWLRNNGSTAISLFIDTTIVIGFMTFFGILPLDKIGVLIANSYLFKLMFTFLSTPLFYLAYFILRKLCR